ncbi:uncharacterized protein METZ01_LOCUS71841 [marine metagenome]|uniref:Aminotransferase class I/classII large domain-containing protein n=1 Tax=marine metagenome TaxID=408172 RepID=A0A381TVJ0_9ZZZZ
MMLKQNKTSTPVLTERVQRVQPSATLTISAKAMALKAQGIDIISLSAGEPDFDTPDHIKEAGIQAIQKGQTKYTPVDGTPELKQAIIDKFSRDNNLLYQQENILVSSGAKQTCFNLFQAVLEHGKEAVIISPYWVSYPDMVLLANGSPVILKTSFDNNFQFKAEDLDAVLTKNTRLIMLNSPSNPTGITYTKDQYQIIGEVLENYSDVLIATDDMYEHIYWGNDKFCSFAEACPNMIDRTITINGVSKAYAMTGWRIGYCAGPEKIISAMKKIQGQSTSNASSVSQAAAVAALNGSHQPVHAMAKEYENRHAFIFNALNSIKGFKTVAATGAFYTFPEVTGVIKDLNLSDDIEFSDFLIENANVAVVPGSAFGAKGHIRLSFATSMELLKEAVNRIEDALN